MKKFKFCVVDDEPLASPSGAGRPFSLLKSSCYLEKAKISPKDTGSFSMNYSIYNPQTEYVFSRVIEELKWKKFDFYFFDIRYEKHNFCDIQSLNGEEVKATFAGLNFMNILSKSINPKFYFSAASEVKDVFRNFRYIKTRLEDIHFGDIEYIDYQNEIEKSIDDYLYTRQIEVLELQSSDFREKLVKRVYSDDIKNTWDIADIPDDEEVTTKNNPEKYWSLRTLFPKQFILIEGIKEGKIQGDIDEVKRFVANILVGDWRKLMSLGMLNHPIDGEKARYIEDLKRNVLALDFELEKKSKHYKKITEFSAFKNTDELNDLRDNILNGKVIHNSNYKIEYLPYQNEALSLVEYFYRLVSPKISKLNVREDVKGWCTNFGIFPTDIAFISNIAFHNKRHIGENATIEFDFKPLNDNCLEFSWTYSGASYGNNDDEVEEKISYMYSKFDDSNKKIKALSDSGMSDICKIICFRYRGVVIFEFGHYKLLAGCNAENCINNKTHKVQKKNLNDFIKVLLIKGNEFINGPKLRLFISKPQETE